MVVFRHSFYVRDLASHIALAIQTAQVSVVVEEKIGAFKFSEKPNTIPEKL